MTSADFADWVRPVGTAEQVTQLASVTLAGTTVTTALLDTSNMGSVDIFAYSNGVAVGDAAQVQVLWKDAAANDIARDVFAIWCGQTLLNPASETNARLTVKGPRCKITMLCPAGSTPNVLTVYGSTRQLARERLTAGAGDNGPLLASRASAALAAGTTTSLFFGPVTSAVALSLDASDPNITASIQCLNPGLALPAVALLYSTVAAAIASAVPWIPVPRGGLRLDLRNPTAGPLNIGARVWDVS